MSQQIIQIVFVIIILKESYFKTVLQPQKTNMDLEQYTANRISDYGSLHAPEQEIIHFYQQSQQKIDQLKQLVNATLQTVNQTLKNILQNQTYPPNESVRENLSYEDDWNLLYFMRLLFYVIVILKIVELTFNRRRKMDIKQRVYRKYVFSHSEIIREFNEDDRKVMQTTLNNTIKNAYIDKIHPKLEKKNSNKRVNFFQIKNEYIKPRSKSHTQQSLQQEDSINLYPKPISVMKKEQQPSDAEFQIVEVIKEEKMSVIQVQKQDIQEKDSKVQEKLESIITKNTEAEEKEGNSILIEGFKQIEYNGDAGEQTKQKKQ